MKPETLEQLAEKWEYSGRDGQTQALDDSDQGKLNDARLGGFNDARRKCAKELRDLIALLSY